MRLTIRKAARADLDSIFLYIVEHRPLAAERMIDRLLDAMRGLIDFPNIGRASDGGRRELVTVRPYVIVYRVGAGKISVLRVLHGAMRR